MAGQHVESESRTVPIRIDLLVYAPICVDVRRGVRGWRTGRRSKRRPVFNGLLDRSVFPRCYGFLVANPMITRAPAMAIAAPTESVNVGRCPSTTHNHISDAAM